MTQKILIFERASGCSSEALLILANFDEHHFPNPWNKDSWSKLFLTSSERLLLVSYENDDVTGLILFDYSVADSFAHLLKIVTDPRKRKMRIGTTLMTEALVNLKNKKITEIYLEVAEENLSAIRLYERFNFKVLHLKKHFYSNGANALIMNTNFIKV